MSVVPFSASAPGPDTPSTAHTDAGDARDRMLDIKRKLEEAAAEIETLQKRLTSQGELEQLLKQGRSHLQDMRGRLQQAAAERERMLAEAVDVKRAHQEEIVRLTRQMDEVRQELQSVAADRDRVAAQLSEQIAAHERFAEERADERSTFKRLLDEASSHQRELVQDLDEQRQQIDTLREAAMRAQSFAREIMRAHEVATAVPPKPPQE